MSTSERDLPARIAGLLRDLIEPETDVVAFDRVSASFEVPSEPAYAIHAAVEFHGTVPVAALPQPLRALTRSRRCDLLGIAWTLLALAPQGRAALVVPERFVDEATQGHVELRRQLVEGGRLHGIVRLGAGCYKARTSAAILLIGSENASAPLWFAEVNDARQLDPAPDALVCECVQQWRRRDASVCAHERTGSSFNVPRAEIAAAQFDLSIDRYRSVESPSRAAPRRPHEILSELTSLEAEIFQGLRALVGLLKP